MSTKEQAEENHSLENQRQRIREFASKDRFAKEKFGCGWTIDREFIGEGESAYQGDRRAWQLMLAHLRESRGKYGAIIVLNHSRFSRNASEQEVSIIELQKIGVVIRSVEQPASDENPDEKMNRRMVAVFDQHFSDNLSYRTMQAIDSARSEGRWPHRPPHGYRPSARPGVPEIDPVAGPQMREAFERVASGESKVAVWQRLQKRGLGLSRTRFYALLQRSFYAGRLEGPEEKAVVGQWTALVSNAVFQQAQQTLSGRRGLDGDRSQRTYLRNRDEYPLKGAVRCGGCDRKLTGAASRAKSGRHVEYYECPSRGACRTSACVRCRPEKLHRAFVDGLLRRVETLTEGWSWRADLEALWRQKTASLRHERRRADQEYTKLLEREARLVDAFTVERSPLKESIRRQLSRLSAEVEAAREHRERCTGQLAAEQVDFEPLLDFVGRALTDAASLWQEGDLPARQSLQSLLFPDGVVFDGEKFRTPVQGPIFRLLMTPRSEKEGLASTRGTDHILRHEYRVVIEAA